MQKYQVSSVGTMLEVSVFIFLFIHVWMSFSGRFSMGPFSLGLPFLFINTCTLVFLRPLLCNALRSGHYGESFL